MKSVPSPKSTRGSSRQSKSSIEPRGVPEFDREYARQLSLARQGRGSLRESPVSTPRLSPQKAQGESPLPQPPNVGEAIKGFVASHVAPLRGSSGTSSPAPEPQLGKSQEKEILPSLPQSGILRTLSVVVVSILLIMVVALGFAVVFSNDSDFIENYFSSEASSAKSRLLAITSAPEAIRQAGLRLKPILFPLSARFFQSTKNDLVAGAKMLHNFFREYILLPAKARVVVFPGKVARKSAILWNGTKEAVRWRPAFTSRTPSGKAATAAPPTANGTPVNSSELSSVFHVVETKVKGALGQLQALFSFSAGSNTSKAVTNGTKTTLRKEPPAARFTNHSFRVNGAQWGSLIAHSPSQIEQLARKEIQKALHVDGRRIGKVVLREGSLVVDFVLETPQGKEYNRFHIEQQLRAHDFKLLNSFYNEKTRGEETKDAPKPSVTKESCADICSAQCENAVEECHSRNQKTVSDLEDNVEQLKNSLEGKTKECASATDRFTERIRQCNNEIASLNTSAKEQLRHLKEECRTNLTSALATLNQTMSKECTSAVDGLTERIAKCNDEIASLNTSAKEQLRYLEGECRTNRTSALSTLKQTMSKECASQIREGRDAAEKVCDKKLRAAVSGEVAAVVKSYDEKLRQCSDKSDLASCQAKIKELGVSCEERVQRAKEQGAAEEKANCVASTKAMNASLQSSIDEYRAQIHSCQVDKNSTMKEVEARFHRQLAATKEELEDATSKVTQLTTQMSEKLSASKAELQATVRNLENDLKQQRAQHAEALRTQQEKLEASFSEAKQDALERAEKAFSDTLQETVKSAVAKKEEEGRKEMAALEKRFQFTLDQIRSNYTEVNESYAALKRRVDHDIGRIFRDYEDACKTACLKSANSKQCMTGIQQSLSIVKSKDAHTFLSLLNASFPYCSPVETKVEGSRWSVWVAALVSLACFVGWKRAGGQAAAAAKADSSVIQKQSPVPAPSERAAPSVLNRNTATLSGETPAPHWTAEHVLNSYFGVLELYYVDLLEAVMNRELLEAQLSDLSTVADEQMGLLQDKGTQLSDLRRVASLKDSELAALRVKCDSLMSSLRETCEFDKKINTLKSAHQEEVAHLREDLEQTRHMRDLQAEMVAVLEEQLTRLSKTLNEVHSGSRGQSTIGGSPIAGERSGNDISGFERHLQHLISEDDCPPEEFSEQFSRGNRPSPAKRDTSTMMRNAENVKLYKPFDWKDVNDTQ